jgi:LmbE family N-acetylglucosaminyl deacetylase
MSANEDTGEAIRMSMHTVKRTRVPLARSYCQRLLRGALRYRSHQIEQKDLRKAAIVFSPHPDDETLGCGGTIIRKIRASADVKIVFMTDGSSSHQRFISKTELTRLRTGEAVSACKVLGLPGENVTFLEFKDQHLNEFQEEAQQKVAQILSKEMCEQVFIPYSGDSVTDHCATNSIVLGAVEKLRSNVVIYEYPIWFWNHWPWTSVVLSSRKDILRKISASLLGWFRLMMKFRWSVCISDVLELKRLALDEHKTQMTRLLPNLQWPILNDVSNGEFLQCFFQDVEVFHRRQLFR